MDRKGFLTAFAATAVGVLCAHCLAGCDPPADFSGPQNIDFTLDLSDPAFHSLSGIGGYFYKDGIIVAHLKNGSYDALSAACTHAGATIYYDANTNLFHCPSHGSDFATDGSVVNGPAGSPLTRYNTSLNGTTLRVYS